MLIDLTKPDLRAAPVGTQVKTTKGFIFEKMAQHGQREDWKDLTSGLTWSGVEDGKYTHHEAVEKFADKLPTKEEFKEAETHGFREVINMSDEYFWSSSVNPNNTDLAYDFNGSNGVIYNDYRSYSNETVVCVGGR